MRSLIALAIGLVVGVVGGILFFQSLPPQEGTAEERVGKLEVELKRANNQLAALQGGNSDGRRRPGRGLGDSVRGVAENIRDGKSVTPDDVFRATQPLIRDLAPLFDRLRVRELQRQSDAKAGEIARKYSLNPAQQESLKKWFDQNAAEEAKRYTAFISQDGTRLEDLAKASNDIRMDEGLDQYMESTLQGEKLTAFKSDRLVEKVKNVQREADMKVTRLDDIVGLDDVQRGQVFAMMARGAVDFDPAMQFEGLGVDTGALSSGKNTQDAVLGVLRPEQRQAYEEDRIQKRLAAQQELEAIGLTLPADFDSSDFLDH